MAGKMVCVFAAVLQNGKTQRNLHVFCFRTEKSKHRQMVTPCPSISCFHKPRPHATVIGGFCLERRPVKILDTYARICLS